MEEGYEGREYVEIVLHRRRSVIVRVTVAREQVSSVWITNDPVARG